MRENWPIWQENRAAAWQDMPVAVALGNDIHRGACESAGQGLGSAATTRGQRAGSARRSSSQAVTSEDRACSGANDSLRATEEMYLTLGKRDGRRWDGTAAPGGRNPRKASAMALAPSFSRPLSATQNCPGDHFGVSTGGQGGRQSINVNQCSWESRPNPCDQNNLISFSYSHEA